MSELDNIAMNSDVESEVKKVEAEKKVEIVDKEIEEAEKKIAELPRKFKDKKEEAERKAKAREQKRVKRLATCYSNRVIKTQLKTAKGYYKECLMAELKRRSEKK